ncbi:MAG TPA: DUF6065 family protein [Dehalococcoidia bacterium]|nr:DUF6065 family protein [Dehalococcoidia bacterium]
MAVEPLVTLYKLFPAAPKPVRADAGLGGSMPARAYHYCEPFRAASSFGWHVFPPIDFDLLWDGTTVRWRGAGARDWQLLEAADLPGFTGLWNLNAPVADVLPRPVYFMHAPRGEPGIVMVSTGVLAKTRPGWSLLVRRPANLPQDPGFEVLEGIIETDWWFGPVASNLRLRKTDTPICFRRAQPLYQLQPLPKAAYAEENLGSGSVCEGFAALSEADWSAYTRSILPRNTPGARPGWYRSEVHRRQRAGCPAHSLQAISAEPVPPQSDGPRQDTCPGEPINKGEAG